MPEEESLISSPLENSIKFAFEFPKLVMAKVNNDNINKKYYLNGTIKVEANETHRKSPKI